MCKKQRENLSPASVTNFDNFVGKETKCGNFAFSAAHILRETNLFESGWSLKICYFLTFSAALKFDFSEFLHFVRAEID